ncbi:MAG: hydrolase [Actinobacteria bacterium HGW-Actinobacteria-2]|nr:MAG: hydrolase [Actinobacteria bacterium HGW-Actinobacteria-2]
MKPTTIRLIASDLDGTLLRPDKSIATVTRTALRQAADSGAVVVAATGRQTGSLPPELLDCAVSHLVGANGAIGIDLVTGEVLFEAALSAATVAAIGSFFAENLPDARLSASREQGSYYVIEPGYLELVQAREKLPAGFLRPGSREEIVAQDTLKMSIRHPTLTGEQMRDALYASGLTGFHATTSGAPFLEIGGAGVTKATGVARLCAHLGVSAESVLAFGDAGNDAELIAWAGWGVAMGNATAELQAIADQVTATNIDNGVARVVEEFLNERRIRGSQR